MGSHHARVYAALTGRCVLAGVHDPAEERGQTLARRWDARAYADVEELLDDVDVVSIASPSRLHSTHARLALERGVDVLVEKPLAVTAEDGRELQRLVEELPWRPVAQVGHIEHFNPAVRELRKLISGHEILAIAVERLGPDDGRIDDADVITDLMLHDVHVLLTLVDSPLVEAHAVGRSVRGAGPADYAVANLVFDGGLIATLSASRITQDKVRRIAVSTAEAHITVDYLHRSVNVCRMTNLTAGDGDAGTYRQESVVERIFVPIEEPLVAQLQSFLAAVRDRRPPEVPLATGVRCLEVVEALREQAEAPARRAEPALATAA
jgi:predicted dehydrogenase